MLKRYLTEMCLILALLSIFCGTAWAQADSGREGDTASVDPLPTVTKVIEATPDGAQAVLPPSLSSDSGEAETDADRLEEPDHAPVPLWLQLEGMGAKDRKNALIGFEALRELTEEEKEEAGRIEGLWNSGGFDAAIHRLRRLEQAGGMPLAMGIHWKQPKPASFGDGGPDTPVSARPGLRESSLDFELLCWIIQPADRGRVTHELNCDIYKRFGESGISIPFPQRDLYIKEMPRT